MSKSDTFENELLLHIFNNAAITLIGDAAGVLPSAAAGSLYLSLHSADPGETGTQSTNEVTYTGYAREAVARSGAGFTVTGSSCVLAALVAFGASTGGGSNATHFGVGTSSSGTGKLLYSGALSGTIPCATSGVTPELGTGTAITED